MHVVFDSSIWLAGIGSRTGFSNEAIFKSYKSTDMGIFISAKIMAEIKRNLIGKFKFDESLAEEAERIIYDLCDYKIKITDQEEGMIKNVNLKDQHILALCRKVSADYLITFDRKHLLPLKKYQKTAIIEPKDFIKILNR